MRWKSKNKTIPKEYKKRIKSVFLFIPTKLEGEWRWLEKASIEQKYIYTYTYDNGFVHKVGYWVDIKFID